MRDRHSAPAASAPPPREARNGLNRSLIYFVTVVTGQALSFFLLPFITRALSPDAYGTYALALAVSGLGGVFASSWVRNLALRLHFDAVQRNAGRSFFLSVALLQAALFITVYAVMLIGLALVGIELASWRVLISAGITLLLGDLAAHTLTILRAEQRTIAFALGEIGAGTLRFGLTLAGLAVGLRSPALLFDATSAGFFVTTVFMIPALWKRLAGSAVIDTHGTKELLRHGPASLPFSVADWMERLVDRLVVEHFLGTAAVGIYSIGYTIGERTIGALVRAVFLMAWPNILAAWNGGTAGAVRTAVGEAQRLYAWFSIGPVVFVVIFGADLLRLIAGPAYQDAAPIVPIVAVSMWLGGYSKYLNRHLELNKRFGALSAITVAGAVVNLALNLVLVPMMGMVGAAWATMGNRLFNAIVFFTTRDRALAIVPHRAIATALGYSILAGLVTIALPVAPLIRMTVFVAVYAPAALVAMRR